MGVLLKCLRDPAGGGDLCLARRAAYERAHQPAAGPSWRGRCIRTFTRTLRRHAVLSGRRNCDPPSLYCDLGCLRRRRHSEGARARRSVVGALIGFAGVIVMPTSHFETVMHAAAGAAATAAVGPVALAGRARMRHGDRDLRRDGVARSSIGSIFDRARDRWRTRRRSFAGKMAEAGSELVALISSAARRDRRRIPESEAAAMRPCWVVWALSQPAA